MRTKDGFRGIGIRLHRCGEGSAWFTPDFEWDDKTGVFEIKRQTATGIMMAGEPFRHGSRHGGLQETLLALVAGVGSWSH